MVSPRVAALTHACLAHTAPTNYAPSTNRRSHASGDATFDALVSKMSACCQQVNLDGGVDYRRLHLLGSARVRPRLLSSLVTTVHATVLAVASPPHKKKRFVAARVPLCRTPLPLPLPVKPIAPHTD